MFGFDFGFAAGRSRSQAIITTGDKIFGGVVTEKDLRLETPTSSLINKMMFLACKKVEAPNSDAAK